ncbi:MAG: DNA polymerase III subunit beta [Pseudomonadota bacterium]|nr:DNA polymerase III subunit beta [Pseudomonadota bacterium]
MPHELQILAQDLAEALGRAVYKPSDDVHKFVKLTTHEGNLLTITSMDGSIILQQNLLHEDGDLPDIAVEAAKLIAALMQRHDTITLKANDACDTLRVQQGKSRFDIPAIKGELFPSIPSMHHQPIEADTKAFLEGLRRVGYAAGRNDSRPHLNGVFVNHETMVATDGYRMARIDMATSIGEKGIITPSHALATINKLVRDDYAINLISHADDMPPAMIEFGGEDLTLYVRLIDALYPDPQAMTPDMDDAAYTLTFTPMQVNPALDRLSRFNEVITLAPTGGKLGIAARDESCRDVVSIDSMDGLTETLIAIRFVQDVLHQAGKEDPITWTGKTHDTFQRLQIDGAPETHYIGAIRR